ncbi:MAG TPA: NlpC/P60 family protein [Ornithinimicrobium sp.]|nr:NlpC/P60 family protein [Ornithinimicrobium sp.]
MKFTGKHRLSSTAPRSGAAALMIGGLVAGTVATAGAVTLKQDPSSQDDVTAALSDDPADAVRDAQAPVDAAEEADQLASLRSSSLSELRDQGAADRSEAREAPADAATVSTLLDGSGFSARTLEVETTEVETTETAETETATQAEPVTQAPAEPAPAEEPVAAPREQAAPAEPVQQTQAQAAPVQQTQPAPEPVQAQPVQQAAPAPVGGSVLSVAAAYVGYPYVLLGTPPYSFDCSSYTWYVFQQAGINIPRTVAGQKAAVTPVSNPQPGDLVFYNDFYHVGIYAGNGMTYEAMNPSTGVRYGPMISSNVWYGRIG